MKNSLRFLLLSIALVGSSFGAGTVGFPGPATDLLLNSLATSTAGVGLQAGGAASVPAIFNGVTNQVVGTTPKAIITLPSNQASVFAFVTGFLNGTGTFYDVIAETGGASPTVISTFTSSSPTRVYTYSAHTIVLTFGSGVGTWTVSAGFISTQ